MDERRQGLEKHRPRGGEQRLFYPRCLRAKEYYMTGISSVSKSFYFVSPYF